MGLVAATFFVVTTAFTTWASAVAVVVECATGSAVVLVVLGVEFMAFLVKRYIQFISFK
jgi:hypothetical protein